jgi:hypothetical protein
MSKLLKICSSIPSFMTLGLKKIALKIHKCKTTPFHSIPLKIDSKLESIG